MSYYTILKISSFGKFFRFVTWTSSSWGAGGYPQNAGVLVVLIAPMSSLAPQVMRCVLEGGVGGYPLIGVELETALWTTFCRWHFQRHFLEWRRRNFLWNYIEICSSGSNWQNVSISSDNGFALNGKQAIIWSSDVPGQWWPSQWWPRSPNENDL